MTLPHHVPSAVASALALSMVLVACATDPEPRPAGPEPSAARPEPSSAPTPTDRGDGPSALDNPNDPAFPPPLIDPDDLVSGGPPPDGIPPIDDPQLEQADLVDWLSETEPVLSLTVGDETRGYPLQIMTWHEIVNDTVDGTPVAVTYCPLCNSGVAFLREVDGRRLDFGTSGMLYADNLVMYDRQTESLWPQLTGEASVGVLTGSTLEAIPVGVTGWAQFRDAHPEALVLTRDTGFSRSYGSNPYVGYDKPNGGLLVEPPDGRDRRLQVKERVIGIRIGTDTIAVPRSEVASAGVLTLKLGSRELVLWHQPGQASALDTSEIQDGDDIGTVGVFQPRIGHQKLTFTTSGDGFVDAETGSTWNALGEATKGPLAGRRLAAQQHLDTFWFAWVAFQPETDIYEG